jgi:hypothetical protein
MVTMTHEEIEPRQLYGNDSRQQQQQQEQQQKQTLFRVSYTWRWVKSMQEIEVFSGPSTS